MRVNVRAILANPYLKRRLMGRCCWFIIAAGEVDYTRCDQCRPAASLAEAATTEAAAAAAAARRTQWLAADPDTLWVC